jgi:PST family polysaccharide transporter
LLLGIVLARLLSPVEFGVVAAANLLIFYANNFTNLGLNNALIQKADVTDDQINSVFTVNLTISVFLFLVTIVFADNIASFFDYEHIALVIRWMSLYYIFTALYYMPVVILRRNLEFKYLSIIEFLQSLLSSMLALALALLGMSYWSLVIPTLCVTLIVSIVLILKTGWIPKLCFSTNMEGLYSFGFWVFLRNQIELLVSKVDYLIVGKYLNIHSLGIYEKSFEFTERAVSGTTNPIASVFYSAFCRVNEDIGKVRSIFLEGCSLVALFSYPVVFGIIGVAPHFVMSCLGEQWAEAVTPIRILAVACTFRILFTIITNVNVAVGKHKVHTVITGMGAIIFIGACLFSVQFGVLGICLSFLLYCFFLFVAGFVVVRHTIGVPILGMLKTLWCPLVGATLMLVIVLVLGEYVFVDRESFIELLLLTACGSAFYLLWGFYFYKLGIVKLSITGN